MIHLDQLRKFGNYSMRNILLRATLLSHLHNCPMFPSETARDCFIKVYFYEAVLSPFKPVPESLS